jgi:hypothetical protein
MAGSSASAAGLGHEGIPRALSCISQSLSLFLDQAIHRVLPSLINALADP